MNPIHVVVQGTLKPDGTLELDEKPNLPAGRVEVTLQPAPHPKQGPGWWAVLQTIWKDQQEQGHKPRSKEEIDAEIQQLRDELEEHALGVERLQQEVWQERRPKPPHDNGGPTE